MTDASRKLDVLIFAHPSFLRSQSMPRYARMLEDGLKKLGHTARIVSPKPFLYHILGGSAAGKWASYFDQYIIFPFRVKVLDFLAPSNCIFAFSDQALGPWVPYVKRHATIVHCHDFLALKSALGHYPENATGLTGKIYQRYIRWGFQHSHNFIAISRHTAKDLVEHGQPSPRLIAVVYNPLTYAFRPVTPDTVRARFFAAGLNLNYKGYLLYVGGDQWYKNRAGLLALYKTYVESETSPLPLVCVSPQPSGELVRLIETIPTNGSIHFLQNISSEMLEALYSAARALIFPSLAEGFGWPIIEAQACGCPVITTDEAPMSEIAGPAAQLIPRLRHGDDVHKWAFESLIELRSCLDRPSETAVQQREAAINWASQFNVAKAMDGYVAAYQTALNTTIQQQ